MGNGFTTAVPQPVFTPGGFVAPTEAAILAGVQADLNTAFSTTLNPSLTTPQGQLATTETAVIGDANGTFLYMANQFDPAFNSGRFQDAIARIYFLSRNPALPTVVQVTCSGLTGVVIPVGALAQDTAGNIYVCQQEDTIPIGGSIVLPFANQVSGPIPCGAGTLTTIYQAIYGWDSVTNADDGVLGNVVESRSDFETRRAQSTAANSLGSLPSILGAVLSVAGVLDAFAYDNYTASPLTYRGVTIAANSLYVAVLGGLSAAVAMAIWSRKAPGCGYTGNTTVTVTDPSSSYNPPAPSYPVTFEIPAAVDCYVLVTITNSALVPSNALTLVQTAIINAFAGADGGPRARIGSEIYASRYYGPVSSISATYTTSPTFSVTPGWSSNIVSILVGSTVSATFTNSAISGTTLTISGSVTGTIAPGNLLTDITGAIAQGTTIVSGSGTSWQVSISQTVTAEAMLTVTMANDLSMNINQAPTVAAAGICLVLV